VTRQLGACADAGLVFQVAIFAHGMLKELFNHHAHKMKSVALSGCWWEEQE
jgi:hypothetical protein